MIHCYDTEFLEDGATIDLISIGIVCEDGREYYAVNSEMGYERIQREDWLCENVIPHLPLRGKVERHSGSSSHYWSLDTRSTLVKPKWVIANEVREFLIGDDVFSGMAADRPELWAYYAAYDHVALAQLWGRMINLPNGIPMWTHDLMHLVSESGNSIPSQDGAQHNALEDARWNMTVLRELAPERFTS